MISLKDLEQYRTTYDDMVNNEDYVDLGYYCQDNFGDVLSYLESCFDAYQKLLQDKGNSNEC
jgi:hypothetical protein